MKKFGLIGRDIAHSGSPEMFRGAYQGRWAYDLIEGPEFEPLWQKFLEDYQGVNITAPFKEKAFEQVAALTANGKGALTGPSLKAGAINLAVKTPEGILGDNTDFSSVVLCIAEATFPGIVTEMSDTFGAGFHRKVHQFFKEQRGNVYPEKPSALIIGCGGAGKAATVATAELGFKTMLMNRTIEKAASFVMDIPEYEVAVCPADLLRGAVRDCDVLVYAASGPLAGLESLTPADFEPKPGHPAKIIVEANYKNPAFSGALLETAKRGGAILMDGRAWLVLQAFAGYPVLTGEFPEL